MKVFSSLHNRSIEDRLLDLLPSGVEFTGDDLSGCEAAILAARSLSAGTGVKNVREWVEKAVQMGVPFLLLARDSALINYAREKGMPEENVISGPKISLNEMAAKLKSMLCADDYEIVVDDEEYLIVAEPEPESLMTAPTLSPIKPPEVSCVFMGVKGGVGVSTVTSMVCSTLDRSVHVEVVGRKRVPSAYCYYGRSPEEAGGSYLLWDVSKPAPTVDGIALVDLSPSVPVEAADALTSAAGCLVLVTDRSEVAFDLTGRMLRAGFKPDILVVNAALSGVGNGVEVYQGEYEDLLQGVQVFELPGGLDEEKVIAYAQRNGVSPCNLHKSAMMDAFAGELTSAVRSILNI
ncbi:MAG: hypothetical protein K6T65_09005 [Peptococcaceae bacterium]|nr:hypothetical protein [Peptococcaceae bacterium]